MHRSRKKTSIRFRKQLDKTGDRTWICDEDVGRSDTMILVSINKETKRIVATSFLRDTYVKLPIKNEFHKLNAAYA